MKKLILGVALLLCTLGCSNDDSKPQDLWAQMEGESVGEYSTKLQLKGVWFYPLDYSICEFPATWDFNTNRTVLKTNCIGSNTLVYDVVETYGRRYLIIDKYNHNNSYKKFEILGLTTTSVTLDPENPEEYSIELTR